MQVVFNNDDFGLGYGINAAVYDCALRGLTTSVSLLADGPAYAQAVNMLQTDLQHVGVGVHLNFTDGPAYHQSFLTLLFANLRPCPRFLAAIKKDFARQIAKIKKSGLPLDHVDSDKHIHLIPALFEITCQLAHEHHLPYIRLVREPNYASLPSKYSSRLKWGLLNYLSRIDAPLARGYGLEVVDAFYGVKYTNQMTAAVIKAALLHSRQKGYGKIEILAHPGYLGDPRDQVLTSDFMTKYAQQPNREREAAVFQSRELLQFLAKHHLERATFSSK